MEPVVLALASNERYFPGLYCAVAGALSHLAPGRKVHIKVLDGGISESSMDILSRLIDRFGKRVDVQFLAVDESVFRDATPGPAQSHMAYCRILLAELLDVRRLIYLDCDILVFRDLAELFDLALAPGKILAAVLDSETSTLGDDSCTIADAMNLPRHGRYFNSGVMLLDLNELRKENFAQQSLEFFNKWSGQYRFWDQSALNFLLHGRVHTLSEYWNRASWRFDAQENNNLDCMLHYTDSVPWLGGTPGPAQVLFERFAVEVGLPVNRGVSPIRRALRQRLWRNMFAPLRALAFPIAALCYRLIGKKDKSAAYKKVARYWFDYIRNAPGRRRLYRQRSEEITRMNFDVHAPLVS